ncbi:hypothetical protein KA047_03135 [Candidatus Saccharibacteria bacterium]|nr:hypothetical protein [Candidatus Saccharibacteria bacterium]
MTDLNKAPQIDQAATQQQFADAYNQLGVAMQTAVESQADKVEQAYVEGVADGNVPAELDSDHVRGLHQEVLTNKNAQDVTEAASEVQKLEAKLQNPLLRTEERAKLESELNEWNDIHADVQTERQKDVESFRDLIGAEAHAKVEDDMYAREDEFWGPAYAGANPTATPEKKTQGASIEDINKTNTDKAQENFDKLSPTQKLVKLAEIEPLLNDALEKAVQAGDSKKIEQYKSHKEQLKNEKNKALEAKFSGASNEELLDKLAKLTAESDKTEHNQVRDEIQRRFTEARALDTPGQTGTAAEKKNSFDQMNPSEKLARIAELEAMVDAGIVKATESGDVDDLNSLKQTKEELQVLRNEALKAKFDGVSDEDLLSKYDSLTDEADKDEREQVRLEMWRRYGEANTQDDGSQAAPEAQPAGKKGWMKRIKDRVKGSRATTAVLTGNVVDGGNGGNGNNDTPERSRRRGCGPILGAAALVGAAVAFGVVAKQKGWDINPFDGDGFSFDNGVGIKSPYNEKFYDYISGTAEFKEANPTVTLPGGEVVSWIPDAPNYDLTAYDQYMNGLLDQMNS